MAPVPQLYDTALAPADRPEKAVTAVQAPCDGSYPADHSTTINPVVSSRGLTSYPGSADGSLLDAAPSEREATHATQDELPATEANPMKEAALSYARMGWAVLPVRPGGKIPAIKNWPELATCDPETVGRWFDQTPAYNIGLATGEKSGNIVVIDLDVKPERGLNGVEVAQAWQMAHGRWPKTAVALTGGGGKHHFYRVQQIIGSSKNGDLGVDIRGNGGQAVLPPSLHESGSVYAWEADPCEIGIADANESVLAFIEHVSSKKGENRWAEKQEVLEGNRDNELFEACCSWQAKGMSDEDILSNARRYNAQAFKPPLDDATVSKKVESATKRYEKGQGGAQPPTSHSFNHARFGKRMLDEKHMCFIDGAPSVWNGSFYGMGWREVERAMLDLDENIKSGNRAEVNKFLDLTAPRLRAAEPRYLAFENGVLDLSDMTLQPRTPDLRVSNVIPHKWNPSADTSMVSCFLRSVSCGDEATMTNLMETIGLCMYRGTELGKCIILKGEGSNGKSTFIKLLLAVLGGDNVSALDMKNIGDRFQTVPLMGKLANLGDDISNEAIRGGTAAIIKKIVTGEPVSAEHKGAETLFFEPYCTLVFSCNEIPELGDSSLGMLRRIHPVPFNAKFDASSPGFDPCMSEKLATEEACEAAIVLGVRALRACIERKGMMPNAESMRMVREIQIEGDSVLCWAVEERGFGTSLQVSMDGRPIPGERTAYEAWCQRSGVVSVSARKFTQRMNELYGTESKTATCETNGGRSSVRVFRRR